MLRLPWAWLAVAFVLDVALVGAGMGVPIFAILGAFVLGWYSVRRRLRADEAMRCVLSGSLAEDCLVASATLLTMLIVWGSQLGRVAEPGFDSAQWGIPQVLYSSVASFWGWMVLMILVSPMLQLMAWSFSAQLTLLWATRDRVAVSA